MSWIPLHAHSQYSILEATCSIQGLIAKALQFQLKALALTDFGNLYGAVDFYKACKEASIKPIIGCELLIAPLSRFEKKRIPGSLPSYPLIVLAKNKKGYQNLCTLSSIGYLEGFYYTPRIDREILAQHAEGLICLSGPNQSFLSQLVVQEKKEEFLREVEWFKTVFKEDFYFEIQRHRMTEERVSGEGIDKETWLYQSYLELVKNQEKIIEAFKKYSAQLQIPCVATNEIRYLEREDWRAHEILINIQSGEPCEIWEKDSFGNLKARTLNAKRQVMYSHEYYFKSPEEMKLLFADFPEAIANSAEIAAQCVLELDFKSRFYPIFVPPSLEGKIFSKQERLKEVEKYLEYLCEKALPHRYSPHILEKVKEKYPDKDPSEVVRERLSYELQIIISRGMSDYLLIVYDFIAWAKNQGIPVGPGRGSGVGSIILYLIGITDIEPLRFHLFFERFINPERISYPDIDVDICMERRQEVIDYTVQKYGKDKVAQIITFGTMKAKMAIKDVGRVLNVPLGKVNAIAKLVPDDLNMTLERALEIDPELKNLYQTDEEVHRLIDIAKRLEGSIRNTGIHAAGLIICGDPLTDHIPICTAKDSQMIVTQYSMKPVEAVGMLKIDFLGLKTLTAIQRTVEHIKKNRAVVIDWVNLPLDNRATFDLLNQGKTQGIFQVESGGMQELAKQLHIDKFEEIIAVGSLYRPGPMEMIPAFIQRKHGKEPIEIEHPLMKDILEETYGIMVYQEQVMQIASRLANYTLGEGDVLRRAMGKKDREEMSKQREKFRQGALKNGIDELTAMRIFDKVEKFASYGFNKSHAAAYAFLTYVTAYLKANFPQEWMASLLTSDRDDLSKLAKILRECKSMGILILSPDINESEKEFVATKSGIRFAMNAIKGIGEAVVEAVLEERAKNGSFLSLYDFLKRIDTKRVGKKNVESFIDAGCFDFTGLKRYILVGNVDSLYEQVSRQQKERSKGIMNLFSLLDEEEPIINTEQIGAETPKQQLLKKEKELLGFYLSGHPMDDYAESLSALDTIPLSKILDLEGSAVIRTAFIIDAVAIKISSKSQKKFAILTISDGMESFELPIWPELYEEKHHLIIENQLIYSILHIDKKQEEIQLQCRWLDDLAQLSEEKIRAFDLAFDREKLQIKMNEVRDRKQKSDQEKKSSSVIYLKIGVEELKLSHVLKMKELFRRFPGHSSIEVHFFVKEEKISSIRIDGIWGVRWEKELELELKAFCALKEISIGTDV